jgi:prepilin peptidase CpaA
VSNWLTDIDLLGRYCLALPLALSLWMAWEDLKARRLPNYLTLGTALAGLAFQFFSHGWPGLAAGLQGLGLGFGLLIIPYGLGGMGAGDVKALAALGAWLGPAQTFGLFVYMVLAGGLMALGVLLWQGALWAFLRRLVGQLRRWVMALRYGLAPATAAALAPGPKTLPYGVAMALGMAALVLRGG